MHTLPAAMITLLAPFAPLFSRRVWQRALVLVAGTVLAPGKRTVCAALRAMGLRHTKRFGCYHRVRNRAKWSSRAVSRVLLGLLVAAFAPDGPLVFGLDETIERRHPQAGTRAADRGQGPLPGCRALQQGLLRQGARAALALPHAPGAAPLGRAGVGLAVPDRAGPVCAA